MWESPINILQKKIVTEIEGDILKAVHEYGVVVDKDELLKALNYDRGQYDKGYADGMKECCQRIVERLEDVRLLAVQNACLDEAGPECYDISCETCYMDRAIEIVKEEGGLND